MDLIFNDRHLFPYFFRTVPDERSQHRVIVLLLKHFGWTWVGILVTDDETSQRSGMELSNVIIQSGICVAFTKTVTNDYTEYTAQVLHEISRVSCDVIVFLGDSETLEEIRHFYRFRKVYIITSAPVIKLDIRSSTSWLQVSLHKGNIPDLKDYLYSFGPKEHPDSGIFNEVYKHLCPNGNLDGSSQCLEIPPFMIDNSSQYGVNNLRYTFSVYSAVYAVAYALHMLHLHKRQTQSEPLSSNGVIKPWEIIRFLKEVNFTTSGGEAISFNENRSSAARFDFMNYFIYPNKTVIEKQFGYFHELDGCDQFLIDDSEILWDPRYVKNPRSVCTESCLPGYRKAHQEGQQRCCYDCLPCAEGEISNQTDTESCLRCPEDHWSNDRRDTCVLRTTEYLSYTESLGLSLVVISLLLCIAPIVVLVVFIKYKETAIVKANNQTLSFILLLSLIFSCLCPLLFIGRPTRISCLLRQVVFGNIFTIAVSSVLAKTVTVILAFRATKPDMRIKRFLGKHFPTSVLIICSLGQVVLCTILLILSPPFPEYNTQVEVGKMILQCNEGSVTAFYIMIGYIGGLAGFSFIVAFLAKNLPDMFNEGQYITFSMLVFCSVWISFIPAYLSTKGKYMVAVEVFAILCSSAGLLGCIFIPKCYIILIRSELNVKSALSMDRK